MYFEAFSKGVSKVSGKENFYYFFTYFAHTGFYQGQKKKNKKVNKR